MTSYVYNPSKKVTELLSKYLEFDPEQLKLGIWSGNLVLENVNLREEALSPLLHQYEIASASAQGRPPLRLKLVSGKIGSLSVQIPWKRLVWGQGDVRVDLRNVVISVALERCEESNPEQTQEAEERAKHAEQFSRDKKQKILRDAEKRMFQKRSIGPWLNAVKKQDAEEKAMKLKLKGSSRPKGSSGRLTKWLRGVSSDIFWRFWVGLQMNIENFKIVLIQDSIELGILLPMGRVIAGKPDATPPKEKQRPDAGIPRPPLRDESDLGSNGSCLSNMVPRAAEVDEPAVEDNEHVDKQVKLVGIGFYIRKLPDMVWRQVVVSPSDIYTSDYIVRPFEVEFQFSLYFPLPADKRKRKTPQVKPPANTKSTDATTLVGSESTNAKRRRGKRDKQPSSEETKVTEAETTDEDMVSPIATRSAVSAVSAVSAIGTITPTQGFKKSILQRRTSITGSSHLRPGKTTRRQSAGGAAILPLARPDDIGAAYASRAKGQGLTAKFDGKLKIGAVQVVCTGHHYNLLSSVVVSAVQIANGRPTTSIQTRYDPMQDSDALDDSFSDQIDHTRALHSQTIRSWWEYAVGALLFELRQRKRLQRIFEEKYLSFAWSRLTYKRAEYIELYIAASLDKSAISTRMELRRRMNDLEEMLCIEQILLYRSIARSIHVRGGTSMPESILSLQKDRRIRPNENLGQQLEDAKLDQSDDVDIFETPGDAQSFLAELSARCETARTRRSAPLESRLPQFESLRRRCADGEQADDISFGYASETKSLRTSRSIRSSGRSVATTAMEGVATSEVVTGMLFAFTASVEKVEVMLVEGGLDHVNGYSVSCDSESLANDDDDSFQSDVLSVLTDDKRFEQDGIVHGALPEESESTDRIYSSSDFLLFKAPEKVILRLVVSKLSCESLGRSGDSKNVNLSIWRILLAGDSDVALLDCGQTGDSDVALLDCGQTLTGDSPLSEIDVHRTTVESPVAASSASQTKVLAVSLIEKNGQNFLQCDAPKVRMCPDLTTISMLRDFVDRSSSRVPGKLIEPSSCDNLRLYILQQNKRSSSSFNCSVRIHGLEIDFLLPCPADSAIQRTKGRLGLSCDIIELYSGTAVDDLKECLEDVSATGEGSLSLSSPNQQRSLVTRQLSMIDVPMMMEAKASSLANHMVCASSGTQLSLYPDGSQEPIRYLKDAIAVEFFCSYSPDTLADFNRSMLEVTVEVSPIYLLISDARLKALFDIFTETTSLLGGSQSLRGVAPPRLEILSGLMLQSIDLSLNGLQMALLPSEELVKRPNAADKRIVMADSLSLFLRIVSKFDLNYPHDEALSSAMQICIDHLSGLGLSLEESWEITNLVMLGFLEDLVEKDVEFQITPDHVADSIKTAVGRAVYLHSDGLDETEDEECDLSGAFLLDVPDGIIVSSCRLFYDSYLNISIPSLYLSSGSGVHLLRVTPNNLPDETAASPDQLSASSAIDKYGLSFHCFNVDQRFQFGSGGMALSTLGSGQDGSELTYKETETIVDIVVEDCEILCHPTLVKALLKHSCLEHCLSSKLNATKETEQGNRSQLFTADRFSVSFFGDDFVPFTRLVSNDMSARIKSTTNVMMLTSQSLGLIDLTPAGELFPVLVSTVGPGLALKASVSLGDSKMVSLEFANLHILLLRRFVNEILQYFVSNDYGFGNTAVQDQAPAQPSRAASARVEILVSNSTLCLPRSSTNFDLIAFHFSSLSTEIYVTGSSFQMPTQEHPVLLRSSLSGESRDIWRTQIKLREVTIFSALLEADSGAIVADNASFRFFHTFCGPPIDGMRVFQRKRADDRIGSPEHDLDSRRADVVWNKISQELVHLDVLVDFDPHLRILVCDPIDRSITGLSLCLEEEQFALLLSVWYSNMQELPLIFPYSVEQLYHGSGNENRRNAGAIPDLGSENLRGFVCASSSKVTSEIAVSVAHLRLTMLSSDPARGKISNTEVDLSLSLSTANIHIVNNEMCITSIASGCAYASLIDHTLNFPNVLCVGCDKSRCSPWPDATFGLESEFKDLRVGLAQPFQFCVHMAPNWSLFNLGLDSPILTLADFDTVHKMLGWFSGYFSTETLGNPNFEATSIAENIRQDLRAAAGMQPSTVVRSNTTDFRLWIANPRLNIPVDITDATSSVVHMSTACGLWYKYVSDGKATIHECVSDSMEVSLESKQPGFEAMSVDHVIRNLSLGVRYAFFEDKNHSDLNVQIPFDADRHLTSGLIVVSPQEVSPPVICKAPEIPNRKLDGAACEVTIVADAFFMTYTAILGLLGIKQGESSPPDGQDELTSSFALSLHDIRVFFLDPQLGEHLPLAALSFPCVDMTASHFKVSETNDRLFFDFDPTDTQVICKATLWADYFKLGSTRNWEPLLEASAFQCNYEKSRKRGIGLTLACASELHLNVSSALLLGLDDAILCYNEFATGSTSNLRQKESKNVVDQTQARIVESHINSDIMHEIPKALDDNQRVAFSLKNMTGVTLRIYRPALAREGASALSYLDHKQVTDLNFLPSVSIIRNLRIADVPYPGMASTASCKNGMRLSQNSLSIQVPGFTWHHEIKVDTLGRSFSKLMPIDPAVKNKVENSWKLSNALALLVEVGLQPGGRQVTIQSAFSLCNRTDYALSIELSPFERLQCADSGGVTVEPGESFHLPPLLLDSSLRSSGTSLGFVFVRPHLSAKDIEDIFPSDIASVWGVDSKIGRCSRPIDLNDVIEESSEIFIAAQGHDVNSDDAITRSQLSCPVIESTDAGSLSPFCMTLETRRSPLIQEGGDQNALIHGPIDYTLSILPPIVIKNLLPKRGRFELMHAVRRKVVWYAELDPGQHASAHSVGLDAPLLLFVDLAFARTPIGEGVLVHHGSDSVEFVKNNPIALKNIGKAGKAMTMQLGKTLTAMGESPDLRSQQRTERESLSLLSPGEKNTIRSLNVADDRELKHTAVRSYILPNEVAGDISVVDGIGQRLVLGIENLRGGGGQRYISVFSRYWIVNTTEHSLRYKQEKSNSFVSGNVFSPVRDGSKAIDNIRSSPDNFRDDSSAIFAGTPGALATSLRDRTPENTASLLERDMPLNRLAQLSFMFNFQEANVMTIGQQRLCVKLSDGTGTTEYESDWSRGFGLDSIGISQVVAMHCKDGRMLEITMVVQKPIFSGKTKVIRFLPRYVFLNKDSSLFHGTPESSHVDSEMRLVKLRSATSFRTRSADSQYRALWGIEGNEGSVRFPKSPSSSQRSVVLIATVNPSEILPFFLPDTRRERLLRFDLGKPWNLGPSISTENSGKNTIRFSRELDLRSLKHISTRSSPKYEIRLPPAGQNSFDGELGLWFETEWGSGKNLIVKAVRKGSFAYNETDIRVGDELVSIDGAPVCRMTFVEAMELLKIRMADMTSAKRPNKPFSGTRARSRNLLRGLSGGCDDLIADVEIEARPLALIFRTIEERMRAVRMKAARSNSRGINAGQRHGMPSWSKNTDATIDVDVELKSLEHSDVGRIICARENISCPFQVKNQSANTTIYYRQKNCEQYEWQTLHPGQSRSYTWEEPLKPRRLHVKAAVRNIPLERNDDESGSVRLRRMRIDSSAASKVFRKVMDEEDYTFSPPVSFRLDEIGFEDLIPLGNAAKRKEMLRSFLTGRVDVERSTRILVLQDYSLDENKDDQMEHHVNLLNFKVADERERLEALGRLENKSIRGSGTDLGLEGLATEAERIMADFSEESASMKHDQVIVEVLQANGLNPDTLVSSCNPYAEVILKTNRRRQIPFVRTKDVKRTYYVRRTVNPHWRAQSFVFEVPPAAVAITRGHCVQIAIKNYRSLGRHQTLGHTQIDLHTLRDQEPLEGWFPLAGRTGRRELEDDVSNWGRGSIRLRVQWIYSTASLLKRFVRLSKSRLVELEESATGMANQLKRKRLQEELKQAEGKNLPAVRLPAILPPRSIRRPTNTSGQTSHRKSQKKHKRQTEKADGVPSLADESSLTNDHRRPNSPQDSTTGSFSAHGEQRKRLHSSGDMIQKFLEQQRVKLPSSRRQNTIPNQEKLVVNSTNFDPEVFRSWINLQALSYANGAKLSIYQGKLQVQFPDDSIGVDCGCPAPADEAGHVLFLPRSPLFRHKLNSYAARFEDSRRSFELAARTTLNSALHSGGFLIIRPLTALNVSDGYAAMTVKVVWGEDVFYSETVESSMNPNWDKSSSSSDDTDIHIHIPPQKTSGLIRISLIGEKPQQRLKTKVEVGVTVLPIGSAIAVCSGCAESNRYTKWFPLNNPKEAQANEYNGRTVNPTESEETTASLFHDYFAPCIQLSLGWKPDDEESTQQSDAIATQPGRSMVTSYFNANIMAFSVALIDSERAEEILSLHLLGLDMTYWETKPKSRLGVSLEWLQVDYQDENASEAVVFAPTPSETLAPVVEFVVAKDNQKSVAEVIALDFIDFSMSEFDLNVEENLVFDLYEFFTAVDEGGSAKERSKQWGSSTSIGGTADEWDKQPSESSQLLRMIDGTQRSDNTDTKLYVRELFLSGLKINLSYLKGRRQHSSTTNLVWPKEDTGVFEPDSRYSRPSEVFAAWSHNTADDQRRKSANGKALNHIFESPLAIVQNIRKFYSGEALKQVYKIIGSLDVFGNPTMLLSSFMSGVRDMVVAPSVALMRSPTDPSKAGIIFAQGTLSLLSHSASGFFGTLARVSASAGQAVAALSLDVEYRDWHRNEVVVKTSNLSREWKKRGLQNVGRLVLTPMGDLLLGVTWGAAGLVIQPLKGFREGGGQGLLRGTAVGLVGLVAKPTVGILDSFTHFTSGIHDIARSVNVLDKRIQPPSRLRLPYSFGPLGMLSSYDFDIARAKRLLRGFPLKSKAQTLPTEIIIHVEILPGAMSYETVAIATSQRVVVIQVKHEASVESVTELCWQGVLAADSFVYSKVEDQKYGHGSSLCLTNQWGDAHSRTESSDDILNDPSMSSSRLGFSITPKEKRTRKATKDPEGNGSDGSHVKRFTIIAEYQFRQQLIRFHNAVCCIGGRLEDLITDTILDKNSDFVEGQTSFGVFFFDRNATSHFLQNDSLSHLDDLPWVPKSVILEHAAMPPSEQKLHLSALREQWSFSDELEAAKNEGGPAWFVEAKARSRFVQQESYKRLIQPRTLSWAECEYGAPGETILEEVDHGDETDSFVGLSSQSIHGFESAQQSEQGESEISEGLSCVDHFPANPLERSTLNTAHFGSQRVSLHSPSPLSKRNESSATPQSRASYMREQPSGDQPNSYDRDRLDRMEGLLERLVFYTTEQAAHSQLGPRDPTNVSLLEHLRSDVSRLRAQVVPDAASYEISLLRSEIATLRAQLDSTEGTFSSSPLQHVELAQNFSAEQVD